MPGREIAAEHTEEPFGCDEHELDLDALCRVIQSSIDEAFTHDRIWSFLFYDRFSRGMRNDEELTLSHDRRVFHAHKCSLSPGRRQRRFGPSPTFARASL